MPDSTNLTGRISYHCDSGGAIPSLLNLAGTCNSALAMPKGRLAPSSMEALQGSWAKPCSRVHVASNDTTRAAFPAWRMPPWPSEQMNQFWGSHGSSYQHPATSLFELNELPAPIVCATPPGRSNAQQILSSYGKRILGIEGTMQSAYMSTLKETCFKTGPEKETLTHAEELVPL
jgi:hypothetical protein